MSDYSGLHFGDLTQRVGVVAVAKVLKHAQPKLVLSQLGKAIRPETLPKNKGKVLKWRRRVPFSASTNTLQEGITPTPTMMEYDEVQVAIEQYGNWVALTDQIADLHEDPVLADATEMLGEQVQNIMELVTWNEIRAGSAVIYANGAGRTSVNTPVDRDLISAAVRQLKAQHAMKLTKGIGASGNFGTTPVAPSYVIVAHTDTERDWRDMETFRPVEEYGSGGRISEDEIGKVEECRIILSPQLIPFTGAGSATANGMKATGGAVDVYPVLVFGEEAYATVKVAGMDSVNMYVKNPGKDVNYSDPLGQRGFVSWKTYFACKILNDNYMVRIEAGVTDL